MCISYIWNENFTKVINLPDTLCRACGTELHVKSQCSECKQANQFTCSRCLFDTDIQYHSLCLLNDIPTIRLSPVITWWNKMSLKSIKSKKSHLRVCKHCKNLFEGENERFCRNGCRDAFIKKLEKRLISAVKMDPSHSMKLSFNN